MKSPLASLPFVIALSAAFGLSSSGTETRPADKPSQQLKANSQASPPVTKTRRPVLQVINGSPQAIEVYWLKSPAERIANGRVEPGENRLISTTLGHRFAIVGQTDRTEITVTSVVPVQAVRFAPPDPDGIPTFYTQRSSAGGFPIVASAKVNP